jgi:3-deoxy-D-manno-octulosonate 8-phosphate phosphatase (KDO 8-P phosphatase)
LCGEYELKPAQIACVFDDINDLPMAEVCGLRLRVDSPASPMFADYVERHDLCDYVTGAKSGGYPVREICELLLGLLDAYDDVVTSRIAFDAEYNQYLEARQSVVTARYGGSDLCN